MTAMLETGDSPLPFVPDEWFFSQEGKVIRIRVSSKSNPVCFKRRQRGHLGTDTSCPKTRESAKSKALKTANLQEVPNKQGYWFVPEAQYAGWVFNDNLDSPDWVWTIAGEPTPRPEVYPPYDSRWQALKTEKKAPKCFTRDPVINVEALKQEMWEKDLCADLQTIQETTERDWVEAVKRYQEEERSKGELPKQRTYCRRGKRRQQKSESEQTTEKEGTDESMEEGEKAAVQGEPEGGEKPSVGGKRKHTDGQRDRDDSDDEQGQTWKEGYPWSGQQEKELLAYIRSYEKVRQEKFELQLILHKEEQKNKLKTATPNTSQLIPLSENPFAPLEREEELSAFLAGKYCESKEDQIMEAAEKRGNKTNEKKQRAGKKLQKVKPSQILLEQTDQPEREKSEANEDLNKGLTREMQLGIQVEASYAQNMRLTDLNGEISLRTVTVQDLQHKDHEAFWERAKREASTLLPSRAIIPVQWDPLEEQWKVAAQEDLSVLRWQLGQKKEDLLKRVSKGKTTSIMGLAGKTRQVGLQKQMDRAGNADGREQEQYDARPLLVCLEQDAALADDLKWRPWWWVSSLPVTALSNETTLTQNVAAWATLLES
ncbi:hypothetical protein CBR_g46655 [Chara braunii]|uniref:Uncharacterized protein n=1 Tax=Chara braunii TaxID=69332 RepID=A0A388M0R4_CHABU|nr:hypothetical protein CBR_g46655 [Chara braunii]|eukprot:GBG88167.1 hypothetical protein CBR_g46655 [Chara braunii]